MQLTEPRVFMIAEPQVDWHEVHRYIYDVLGVEPEDWQMAEYYGNVNHGRSDIDKLTELMARLCYQSFGTELNPNIEKIREDPEAYLDNIIASGHGSVMEHAQCSFIFHDVSRVFTHELITHRVGTAKSQESLRFVRLDEIKFWIPEILRPYRNSIVNHIDRTEQLYTHIGETAGIDKMSFHDKKQMTSAMRRIAPIGLATSVGWSSNIRTLRHTIERRTDPSAEIEIRIVFDQVAQIMQRKVPLLFSDYKVEQVDGVGHWKTEHPKV